MPTPLFGSIMPAGPPPGSGRGRPDPTTFSRYGGQTVNGPSGPVDISNVPGYVRVQYALQGIPPAHLCWFHPELCGGQSGQQRPFLPYRFGPPNEWDDKNRCKKPGLFNQYQPFSATICGPVPIMR
jgi:hypothetical protein